MNQWRQSRGQVARPKEETEVKAALIVMALAAPAIAVGQTTHVIARDHAFGCHDKAEYQQLVRYAADRDMNAFKKGMLQGMLAGRCAMFQKGEAVYLNDTSLLSGMTNIRKAGDIVTYWTAIENVGR